MNYQSVYPYLLPLKGMLLLALGLTLAWFGASAFVGWLLLMLVLLPVVFAMRLHTLENQGVALLPKNHSQWTVYVYGLPVQETRSSLTNPCFVEPRRARRFFIGALTLRLLCQLWVVIELIMEVLQITETAIIWLVALTEAGLLYGLVKAGYLLWSVLRQCWLLEACTINDADSDLCYWRGWLQWRNRRLSALDAVTLL